MGDRCQSSTSRPRISEPFRRGRRCRSTRAARSSSADALSSPPMAQDVEVAPFTADHLDEAAALLAQRQVRLRAIRPELPTGFTEPGSCRPLLAALLDGDGSHGVVAVRAQRMAAFLIGFPRYEPIWGRACWSPIEGQAYDNSVGPEVMRDLYAVWSRHFVDRGFF